MIRTAVYAWVAGFGLVFGAALVVPQFDGGRSVDAADSRPTTGASGRGGRRSDDDQGAAGSAIFAPLTTGSLNPIPVVFARLGRVRPPATALVQVAPNPAAVPAPIPRARSAATGAARPATTSTAGSGAAAGRAGGRPRAGRSRSSAACAGRGAVRRRAALASRWRSGESRSGHQRQHQVVYLDGHAAGHGRAEGL